MIWSHHPAFFWIGLAIDWIFDGFGRLLQVIALDHRDLWSVSRVGEDWRASMGAADTRRRARQALSLVGRRVSDMVCSGDLGVPRMMLVG